MAWITIIKNVNNEKLLAFNLLFSFLSCQNDAEDVIPEEPCIEIRGEFTYGSTTSVSASSCNGNSSNDPSIMLPNPKPEFINGGQAGTFSAEPAGIVFVSEATGEIDRKASTPGTYTITNTLESSCHDPATAFFMLHAPLGFTVEEVPFPTGIALMTYYRIKESQTNPDWQDESKYTINWYHIESTGNIRKATDPGATHETSARMSFANFITPNAETGATRNSDALCVDVINLTTGCVTRKCFGAPLSSLPEPGRNL